MNKSEVRMEITNIRVDTLIPERFMQRYGGVQANAYVERIGDKIYLVEDGDFTLKTDNVNLVI